jgi:transposase-like protein
MPWIRAIYRAETEELARTRLDEFEAEWGRRYPVIRQAWRWNWDHMVPWRACVTAGVIFPRSAV